jgi:hypothetical protein
VAAVAVALVSVTALAGCQIDDSDGDGIPDVLEIARGWDPYDADQDRNDIVDGVQDSDADGLTDWSELNMGTDPLVTDTDGGGIDDRIEVGRGSDPLDGSDDMRYD